MPGDSFCDRLRHCKQGTRGHCLRLGLGCGAAGWVSVACTHTHVVAAVRVLVLGLMPVLRPTVALCAPPILKQRVGTNKVWTHCYAE